MAVIKGKNFTIAYDRFLDKNCVFECKEAVRENPNLENLFYVTYINNGGSERSFYTQYCYPTQMEALLVAEALNKERALKGGKK